MISYIWGGMLLAGILYSAIFSPSGLAAVTGLAVSSSRAAVQLSLTMLGVIAMWAGLMNIAEKSGLIGSLTDKMESTLTFLFPKLPKNSPAKKHIAANFIANILGLGWAATPSGLNAMKELQKINTDKSTASDEMCLFMVINISSLQLISVNLLAYRLEYGSKSPSEIIGPGIAVTLATTIIGVIICKTAEKLSHERNHIFIGGRGSSRNCRDNTSRLHQ